MRKYVYCFFLSLFEMAPHRGIIEDQRHSLRWVTLCPMVSMTCLMVSMTCLQQRVSQGVQRIAGCAAGECDVVDLQSAGERGAWDPLQVRVIVLLLTWWQIGTILRRTAW